MKTRNISLLLVVPLALAVSSCCCQRKCGKTETAQQKTTGEIVEKNGTVVNATARIDDQTTWILRSMKAKRVTYAQGQEYATLHFNPEAGLLGGSTCVNRFNANYTLTPASQDDASQGTLDIGPLMSTKMAGPNDFMMLENAYMNLLDKVDGYEVGEYELKLMQGDKVVLTFEKGDKEAE